MRELLKDSARLEHILEAIERVEEYTKDVSRNSFDNDKMRIHATAYNIQIIGEASYKLSKEFKQSHTDTPWRLIEKMRHILVHDYFTVDLDFVWLVITEDLSLLKEQVIKYLEGFSNQ